MPASVVTFIGAFTPVIIVVALVLAVIALVKLPNRRVRRQARDRRRAARSNRSRQQRRRRGWLLAALGTVAVGAGLAVLFVPAQLLKYWAAVAANPNLDSTTLLAPAAQVVLLTLAGLVGLVTLALSYDRHGAELDKEANATERDFRARFTKISESLASSEWTRRSNGLRELGILADDWYQFGRSAERTLCVDVLCEHLRSPWPTDQTAIEQETRVREVGFSVIAQRLRAPETSDMSWHSVSLDLRGAVIRKADLSRIQILPDTRIDFRTARVEGEGSVLNLSGATVSGSGLQVGDLTLAEGAQLVLRRARIAKNGSLHFYRLRAQHSHIHADEITIKNHFFAAMSISSATLSDTKVNLTRMKLLNGGFEIRDSDFSDCEVDLTGLEISDSYFTSCELELRYLRLVDSSLTALRTSYRPDDRVPFSKLTLDLDQHGWSKQAVHDLPESVPKEERRLMFLRGRRDLDISKVRLEGASELRLSGLEFEAAAAPTTPPVVPEPGDAPTEAHSASGS